MLPKVPGGFAKGGVPCVHSFLREAWFRRQNQTSLPTESFGYEADSLASCVDACKIHEAIEIDGKMYGYVYHVHSINCMCVCSDVLMCTISWMTRPPCEITDQLLAVGTQNCFSTLVLHALY